MFSVADSIVNRQGDTTMKPPPMMGPDDNDNDDIFGPPRTYPTGYCPPKNRPSMISAKYRQKEERRKVLKISINKLKKIEDPEASLCRSVLINNTMKRLQQEARDEKMQKQPLHYPRCYYNDNYLNLKNEFIKNEISTIDAFETENFVENDFDTKLAEEINEVKAQHNEVLSIVEENLNSLSSSENFQPENATDETTENSCRFASRKRSFDEVDECDMQEVLSQFYMPPTPRMLTSIDDDEDVNVVDDEPLPKRLKADDEAVSEKQLNCVSAHDSDKAHCDKSLTDFSANNFLNNNVPNSDLRLRYNNTSVETETSSYSCGHVSMFNELQNNVFHNLIASLET